MLRMGIIGAENSHAAAIATLINVEHRIPDIAVTHLWGETRAFAQPTAEKGQISTIVRKTTDMLGQVDCVMIDHRDGKYHLPAAEPFIQAGIPCFIDKPLSTSTREAKRFLALARAKGVAVTSFSAISQQSSIAPLKATLAGLGALRAVHFAGPGNYRGKYGGIFFYAIHQVDLMVELFGTGVKTVEATTTGTLCTLVCQYPEFNATITVSANGTPGWYVTAIGEQTTHHDAVAMDDSSYLPGTQRFVEMFRTGVAPYDAARLLAPVAILEAAAKSIATKQRVKLASLALPEPALA